MTDRTPSYDDWSRQWLEGQQQPNGSFGVVRRHPEDDSQNDSDQVLIALAWTSAPTNSGRSERHKQPDLNGC